MRVRFRLDFSTTVREGEVVTMDIGGPKNEEFYFLVQTDDGQFYTVRSSNCIVIQKQLK